MHRLSNGTQVDTLPTPAQVTGTPGYATAGIVGQQAPSDIDPDAFNAQQEELCAIVEAAKLALDKADNTQVLAALRILFAAAEDLASEIERAQGAEQALSKSMGGYLPLATGGTVNGDVALGNGKWLHVDTIVAASAAAISFGWPVVFNSTVQLAGDLTLTNGKWLHVDTITNASADTIAFGAPVEFDSTVKVDGDLTLAKGKWLHVDTITDGGSGKTSFAGAVEFDSALQADGGVSANVLSGISGAGITAKNHLICNASLSVSNTGTQFAGNQGDASNPIGGTRDGAYFDGHSLFAYGSQTPVYIGTGTSTNLINFYNGSTVVGGIANQGSSVAYNTTSDYRAKTDVHTLGGVASMGRILAMRPVAHRWKNTPDQAPTHGFIAHELQAVAPFAVTGDKDAVDVDGKPVLQAVDLTRLVPDLVAALQGALRRIDKLEAMVVRS